MQTAAACPRFVMCFTVSSPSFHYVSIIFEHLHLWEGPRGRQLFFWRALWEALCPVCRSPTEDSGTFATEFTVLPGRVVVHKSFQQRSKVLGPGQSDK